MARRLFPSLLSAALLGAMLAGAGALAHAQDPPKAGFAPDPPALARKKQWVFEVAYKDGKPKVERARAVTVAQSASTPRMMGRFALELYVGRELLDRVRFNFPLTGDPPEKSHRRTFGRPTFENVTTRLKVTMADNPRATRAQLVDRATGATQRLPWPPGEDGKLTPDPLAPTPPQTVPDAGPDAASPVPGDAAVRD